MTSPSPKPVEDHDDDEASQGLDKKERKKRQNRIAQRNYRLNQKRRIQALEAAAAFPSTTTTANNMLPTPPDSLIQDATCTPPRMPSESNWPSEVAWGKTTTPSPVPTCLGDGRTPLHLAAHSGNGAITRILLEHGANVDSQDISFKTALHIAAENKHDGIVEMLLARSADPNKADISGRTPLFPAVELNNERIVGLLLASRADVNAMDVMGRSALHLAVAGESETLTALLLSHGANINAQPEVWES